MKCISSAPIWNATARRMISGDALKQRNGFVIHGHDETRLAGSS